MIHLLAYDERMEIIARTKTGASSDSVPPPYFGTKNLKACSLGRIWLISRVLSANEQYFSLTPNQSIVQP